MQTDTTVVHSLVPVLPALSRLIARGVEPTVPRLELLLQAVDIDSSAVAEELVRCGALLQRGQTLGSGAEDVTIEALRLRGVPEDLARESVSIVLGNSALCADLTTVPGRYPMPVDSASRDRPLEAILHASSDGETVELPRGRYSVDDGITLSRSVTIQGNGNVVLHGDGEVLLKIEGDAVVNLIGLGFERTGDGDGALVEVGAGDLQMRQCTIVGRRRGVGIQFLGESRGRVEACRFEGLRNGVCVGDRAKPLLQGNVISGPHADAYLALEKGDGFFHAMSSGNGVVPVVEPSEAGETSAGIVFDDQSAGAAEGNTCRYCTSGIKIYDEAVPDVENNICEHNWVDGVLVFGKSEATIRNNTCVGNQRAGINVLFCDFTGTGFARGPLLRRNTCSGNRVSGIVCNGVTLECTSNRCEYNAHYGIHVWGITVATLRENICSHNAWDGILFEWSSGGEATANTCDDNGQYGLQVWEDATPLLHANNCTGNGVADVWDIRH